MSRRYLNERHREYCETLRKSVEKMAKHPMTREEMKAQCDRNKANLNNQSQTMTRSFFTLTIPIANIRRPC